MSLLCQPAGTCGRSALPRRPSWRRAARVLPGTTPVRTQGAGQVAPASKLTSSVDYQTPRAPSRAAPPKKKPAKSATNGAAAAVDSHPHKQFASLGNKPRSLRVLKASVNDAAALLFGADARARSGSQVAVAELAVSDAYSGSVCVLVEGRRLTLAEFCQLFHYTDIKTLFKHEFNVLLPNKGRQSVAALVASKEAELAHHIFTMAAPRVFHMTLEQQGDEVVVRLVLDVTNKDMPRLPQESKLAAPIFDSMPEEKRQATVAKNKNEELATAVFDELPRIVDAIRRLLGPRWRIMLPGLPQNDNDALPYIGLREALMMIAALDPHLRGSISMEDCGELSCLYVVTFKDHVTGNCAMKVGFTTPARGDSAKAAAAVQAAARRYFQDRGIVLQDPSCTPVVWTYVPKASRHIVKQLVKGFLRAVVNGREEAMARDHLSKEDMVWGLPSEVMEGEGWRFVEPVVQSMVMVAGRSHDRAMRALDPEGERCGTPYVAMLGRDVESMRAYADRDAVASVPLHRLPNLAQRLGGGAARAAKLVK